MTRSMFRATGLLATICSTVLPLAATHAGTPQPVGRLQTTQSAVPTWDISFVYANLDTVVVEIKIANPQYPLSSCYATTVPPPCSLEQMHWVITPCPLKFAGSTSYVTGFCSGGTFDFSPPFADNVPIRVALRAGFTYTFSGYLRYYGVIRSHDGACDNVACTYDDEPAPRTYEATVATEPTTWGHVKSLYRSP